MGGLAAGCLAMMITITTSGGIGGFGLVRSARLEVSELPSPLQAEACARLDPTALDALETPATRGGADRIVYHIVISIDGSDPRAFDLPETALPDATLDLIDALLAKPRGD